MDFVAVIIIILLTDSGVCLLACASNVGDSDYQTENIQRY